MKPKKLVFFGLWTGLPRDTDTSAAFDWRLLLAPSRRNQRNYLTTVTTVTVKNLLWPSMAGNGQPMAQVFFAHIFSIIIIKVRCRVRCTETHIAWRYMGRGIWGTFF
jgi:hypothetical protein